jgi:hypothetical protein
LTGTPGLLAMRSLVILVILFAAHAARADQCELVTEAQAENALVIIRRDPRFATFCEPCREKAPQAKIARTVEVRKNHSGFTLYINAKPVDLAYTYYPATKEQFRNLAMAVGCEVESVSETITIK